jgi:hypothetical protein
MCFRIATDRLKVINNMTKCYLDKLNIIMSMWSFLPSCYAQGCWIRCCLPLRVSRLWRHGSRVAVAMMETIYSAFDGGMSFWDLGDPMTPTPPLSLELSQSSAFVDRGGLDAAFTHLYVDIRELWSLSDVVMIIDAFAPSFEALFVKEVSGLLFCLEAASPRVCMEIACLLTGKSTNIHYQEGEEVSGEQK